jgi:hypothetical protein
MAYTIITTTNARRDIQQAIDWENMRKPGLGEYFLSDFEAKLTDLTITPAIGSIRYENVRITFTKIFLITFAILLKMLNSWLLYSGY